MLAKDQGVFGSPGFVLVGVGRSLAAEALLTVIPAAATKSADATSVIVRDHLAASPASSSPQRVSPRFSACESRECTVARVSLAVRRLTRIVAATRIVGNPKPLTSRDATMAIAMFGACANRTIPVAAIPDAAT